MKATKEELEKKIEEVSHKTRDPQIFYQGLNSPEAKALWQYGMYTEEEVRSYGEFILKLSNKVIRNETKLVPLNEESGQRLLNSVFDQWLERNKKKS
jgi:hypothetical protein